MKKIFILSLSVAAILFASCSSNKIPENFDYGQVKNNVYKNTFFDDLQITIPEDWVIQSQEQNNQLMQDGRDIMSNQNEDLGKILKATDVNSATLLSAFKYEIGAPVNFNQNIILAVENIKKYQGIKTGKDYWFHTRRLLLQSGFYEHVDENCQLVNLGGKKFYQAHSYIENTLVSATQSYYATVINGFCLIIILSYENDDEEAGAELLNILNTLKFN